MIRILRNTLDNNFEWKYPSQYVWKIRPIIVSTSGNLINVISLHRQCIEAAIHREAIDSSNAVENVREIIIPRIFYFIIDNIYIYLIVRIRNYNYPFMYSDAYLHMQIILYESYARLNKLS